MTENSGPLAGIKVIDLTTEVLGPIATQTLGDMGAEIIKVESLTGDPQRKNGFPLAEGMTSIYLAINRNKKSISANLKTQEGKEILLRLISQSDVIIHNMRLPAIDRLGFGYKAVREINPNIIYCVATGFDQDGVNKNMPAFDDIIQAGSGFVSLNSLDKSEPEFLPTVIGDKSAGIFLSNSVIAALFHRERTGIAQYIEVPLFESSIAFMMFEHMGGMTTVPQSGPSGYSRILHGGRKLYSTKDGFFAMLPYTSDHWGELFNIRGKMQLGIDLGIGDRLTRNLNFAKIYAEMQKITSTLTLDQIEDICAKLDIPFSRINTLENLLDNEQLKDVKLFVEDVHPEAGHIRYIRPTIKFSETPASVRSLAARLGGNTLEILYNLNYSEDEIAEMIANGVIKT